MRKLYVAIGVDCDPDRDVYPHISFRGMDAIPDVIERIPQVRYTFNVRCDSQIWGMPRVDGCRDCDEIAWHLHFYNARSVQDMSDRNVDHNITLGFRGQKCLHSGWSAHTDYSLKKIADCGVTVDSSPLPRMKQSSGDVNRYDWSDFSYRPQLRHGLKMIPTYTANMPLLNWRFGTERTFLSPCVSPILYRSFVRQFFKEGHDFFVTFCHSDEFAPHLRGWRRHLYSVKNYVHNIGYLERMAARKGFEIDWLTVSEMADRLFGGYSR